MKYSLLIGLAITSFMAADNSVLTNEQLDRLIRSAGTITVFTVNNSSRNSAYMAQVLHNATTPSFPLLGNTQSEGSSWGLYLASAAGLTYVAFNGLLIYYTYLVNHGGYWSKWYHHHAAECATTIKQALLDTLATRYSHAHFLSPIVSFINETEKEQAFLQRYCTLYKNLKCSYLSFLWYCPQQTYEMAQYHLESLTALQQLLTESLSDYKYENI